MLTGTDEHGSKVAGAARNAGVPLASFVQLQRGAFVRQAQSLGVGVDTVWSHTAGHSCASSGPLPTDQHLLDTGTSCGPHASTVASLVDRLSPHLRTSRHAGYYCPGEEAFVPDEQVVDGLDSQSGKPVEWLEEEVRVLVPTDGHREQVRAWLHSDVVLPSRYATAAQRMLDTLPESLIVSRPRDRVPWGVRVPGWPDDSVYVWLDALSGYLPRDLASPWPALHIVGKDILRFHAILWPLVLAAADLPLPAGLLVHGHFTAADGRRISKTAANAPAPVADLIDKLSCDGLRWYLARRAVLGDDVAFEEDRAATMAQKELGGRIGNLLLRVASPKLLPGGGVPDIPEACPVPAIATLATDVDRAMATLEVSQYADILAHAAHEVNAHLTAAAPWATEDAQARDASVAVVLESLRILGILLQPLVPTTAQRLLAALGVPSDRRMMVHATWGGGGDGWVGTAVQRDTIFDVREKKAGETS